MHSFHHSRGRIFFEIFCALVIAAACGVAWLQTGASAMLAIAAVAAVYSLVHATDAGKAVPAAAAAAVVDPEPAAEEQGDLLAYVAPINAEPVAEPQVQPVAKAPKPKRKPRKKQPVLEAPADLPAPEPVDIEVPAEEPEPVAIEEEYHAPVTPLFEPQPLVRQQRTVFGRKAG